MTRAHEGTRPKDTLRITEIFHSIQGESSQAGRPSVFVRLTGCSLRCRYCDTAYAFSGGNDVGIDEIIQRVASYRTPLVEITGGEPLEQPAVFPLMARLLDRRYTVMLETGGHVSLSDVPRNVVKIIDVKCPDSGEGGTFCQENLELAAPHDEFKFVVSSRRDYEWAREFVAEHLASAPQTLLFSPAHQTLSPSDLSGWILEDALRVRLQIQIHKYIWDADRRGI